MTNFVLLKMWSNLLYL